MLLLNKKLIIGGAVASLVGILGISAWGSRYIGPQTVEESLIWRNFRPLDIDQNSAKDKEEWIKKIDLAKKQSDETSYFSAAASGFVSNQSEEPRNIEAINRFKSKCYGLLKTGWGNEDYYDSFNSAEKYCVIKSN